MSIHACSEWPTSDSSEIFFIINHGFMFQDTPWVFLEAYDKASTTVRTVLLNSFLANKLPCGTLFVHIVVDHYVTFNLVITKFLFYGIR